MRFILADYDVSDFNCPVYIGLCLFGRILLNLPNLLNSENGRTSNVNSENPGVMEKNWFHWTRSAHSVISEDRIRTTQRT